MMDAEIRHDPAIRVAVSGRIVGRAGGGMADTIRRRMVQQDEFTDDQVEPARDALRRYSLRYRARCAWGGTADAMLAGDIGLSGETLGHCLEHRFFGAAWAELEASPTLIRRRVRFADLTAEIAIAEALLHRLTVPELVAAE